MKISEQFIVPDESPQRLWKVVDQPELVATCMPGVESVEVVDPDNVRVLISQAIGPMSATFDMRVRILERIDGESIRFAAIGKSVRGAVGTVRAENSVTLAPLDAGTQVTLASEVALAGALGSVGQKIVAKQADRVTATFAENLRRLLAGETPDTGAETGAPHRLASPRQMQVAGAELPPSFGRSDRWVQASFAMSAVSTAIGIAVLIRLRRVAHD